MSQGKDLPHDPKMDGGSDVVRRETIDTLLLTTIIFETEPGKSAFATVYATPAPLEQGVVDRGCLYLDVAQISDPGGMHMPAASVFERKARRRCIREVW